MQHLFTTLAIFRFIFRFEKRRHRPQQDCQQHFPDRNERTEQIRYLLRLHVLHAAPRPLAMIAWLRIINFWRRRPIQLRPTPLVHRYSGSWWWRRWRRWRMEKRERNRREEIQSVRPRHLSPDIPESFLRSSWRSLLLGLTGAEDLGCVDVALGWDRLLYFC